MTSTTPDSSSAESETTNRAVQTHGEGTQAWRLLLFGVLLGLAGAGVLLWLLGRPVPATITLHAPPAIDLPDAPVSVQQPETQSNELSAPLAASSGNMRASSVEIVGGLIDINRATIAELDTLPGIGEARAMAIVAGRPYTSIDELDRVDGIGPATIEALRHLVTVE